MSPLALTAALVFVLDQLTKWLVVRFQPHEVQVLGKFFQLTFVTNRGAAWGLFSKFEHSNAVLAAFSIATALALFAFRRSLATAQLSQRLALGMIVGGIFGNLADRIHHGFVVDFLDFYFGARLGHWPAFNVADSAICVGVVIYLILALRGHAADARAILRGHDAPPPSDAPPGAAAAPEK
jgi:signal peptidase II